MHPLRTLKLAFLDYSFAARATVKGLQARTAQLTTGTGATVILIPGVWETTAFMAPLEIALTNAGHQVHRIDALGFNHKSIDVAAQHVDNYIRERNLTNVVMVGHSKGGLVGKYVMAFLDPDAAIKELVAISSPFSGSHAARLFRFPQALTEFHPRSPIIVRLGEETTVNERITSLWAKRDPHIPQGSHVEGAHNYAIDTVGHYRVVGHADVITRVIEIVENAKP